MATGCSGRSASVLVEYPRAERCAARGDRVCRSGRALEPPPLHGGPSRPRAVGDRPLGRGGRSSRATALADGRGGITTRITALHVLGYVALGRGELDEARAAPRGSARPRARNGRAPAPVAGPVGPGRGGPGAQATPTARPGACEEASGRRRLSRRGLSVPVRRHRRPRRPRRRRPARRAALAGGGRRPDRRCGRSPGTHAGPRPRRRSARAGRRIDRPGPRPARPRAVAGWAERGRIWEGDWAAIDLARAHLRVNRRSDAARLAAVAAATRPAARRLRPSPRRPTRCLPRWPAAGRRAPSRGRRSRRANSRSPGSSPTA